MCVGDVFFWFFYERGSIYSALTGVEGEAGNEGYRGPVEGDRGGRRCRGWRKLTARGGCSRSGRGCSRGRVRWERRGMSFVGFPFVAESDGEIGRKCASGLGGLARCWPLCHPLVTACCAREALCALVGESDCNWLAVDRDRAWTWHCFRRAFALSTFKSFSGVATDFTRALLSSACIVRVLGWRA